MYVCMASAIMTMRDEILKLKGDALENFIKYDNKKLSETEVKRNKKSHSYYIKHCNC